jgi:hypothetical protein
VDRQRASKWIIAGVAALALFGIGSALYNSGWSQGYSLGLLTGGGDPAELAPYLAYRGGPGMGHGGFFGFFGFVFRIAFLLLFFALLAKLFFFAAWRMHGGRGPWSPEQWQHGPWRHGPWGDQPQQQPQQPPQQPQTPAQPQQPGQGAPSGGPDQPDEGPRPVAWTKV